MRRAWIVILFSILIIPGFALADVSDECVIDDGKANCECSGDLYSFPGQVVTSVDECISSCSATYGEIPFQYSVQCLTVPDTISQGTVDNSPQKGEVEEEFEPPNLGVQIPGLEFGPAQLVDGEVQSNYLGTYISALYNWAIGAAAIVAIVMIMVAGLQWTLARGNSAGIGKAKNRIVGAVTGMILLLSAYTIAFLIDPNATSFDSLNIKYVETIQFAANETPYNFVEQNFEVVATVGNGTGWNSVPMYDQTSYKDSPYGPETEECFTETSGNVKSSGCGATSFAMVASNHGANITPDIVAETFWDESINEGKNFRPQCGSCGCNGTHFDAFITSRLVEENGLMGRHIGSDRRDEIIYLLSQGKTLIYLYKTESGGGHYVVLTGIDSQDMVLVNNPWRGKKERRTLDQIFSSNAEAFTYVDSGEDFISEEDYTNLE